MLRCRVLAVRAEVAQAHELIGFRGPGCGERALDLAAREDLEGIRVQALEEVLVRCVGIGIGEEVRIQAYLGVYGLVGLDPVDGGLDLAAVGGVTAAGGRVIFAKDLRDVAVRILDAAGALDDIGTLQAS